MSWVNVGNIRGPTGATGATGATGSAGTPGTPGTNGTNGATILSGAVNPAAGTGNNGDFYLNTTTSTLFGPKAGGAWPGSGTSLVGPAGQTGQAGATGGTGPPGPPGGQYNVTVGPTAPASPSPGDIWIQTS